jgi:transposase InsO family protein
MRRRRWTVEQISEVINQAKQLGLSYKDASQRFGVPVWSIYKYNYKSNKQSGSHNTKRQGDRTNESQPVRAQEIDRADGEPSSAPGSGVHGTDRGSENTLPEEVLQIIIDYRRQNPYHGFKRIEQHLRNRYFLVVPRKRIRQVLKDAGLLELHDSSFDKPEVEAKGTRRFEADRPCELYQMDITYVYITGLKVVYLIDVLDDYSRFCLSSVLRFDQSAETLIEVLHDAISEYGKPDKLVTDEGRAFYSWSGEKTKFQHYLDDQRIEHIVADPHSPTTTGKVERFHQTIKSELIRKVKFKGYTDAVEKIKAFVHHYNYERPHQGLDGARPADRFMGVNAGRTCACQALLDKELSFQKGYLIFKFGSHEVSMIMRSSEAPHIFVNGIGYTAHSREMN